MRRTSIAKNTKALIYMLRKVELYGSLHFSFRSGQRWLEIIKLSEFLIHVTIFLSCSLKALGYKKQLSIFSHSSSGKR